MTKKMKIGILISGRGSNMASLIDACQDPDYPAEVSIVVSNRPNAKGLQTARDKGLKVVALDHKAYRSREAFEHDLDASLMDNDVELICNAGFMRLLTSDFVEKWRNRQLNIHPSLLPSFKGLHTHQRVLDAGVKITGCTVHFVRTDMDAGPVVAQAAIPVFEEDTEESLAARVLKAEHKIYPHALRLVASGEARVEGEKVVFSRSDSQNISGIQDCLFVPKFSHYPSHQKLY